MEHSLNLPLPPKSLTTLPSDIIINNILPHLQIDEAVRTSILSRPFRYLWRSIPDIQFTASDTSSTTTIIDNVLGLHSISEPIRSFSLGLSFQKPPFHHHLMQWLSSLSTHPIQILVLHLSGITRPVLSSRLFSISTLVHLELECCDLHFHPPPPSSKLIQGLRSLQTLKLKECSFLHNDISVLIRSCPLLEKVVLVEVDAVNGDNKDISVSSRSLCSLYFEGEFDNFALVEVPNLIHASINLNAIIVAEEDQDGFDNSDDDESNDVHKEYSYSGDECNLSNMFGNANSIQMLELLTFTLVYLGEYRIPKKIDSGCFESLNVLKLGIEFYYVKRTVLVALCLLRSSPNLEVLEIRGQGYKDVGLGAEFWREQIQYQLDLPKLMHLKLTDIVPSRIGLEFTEFLLPKAQGVKKMIVNIAPKYKERGGCNVSKSTELMKRWRALTQAKMSFRDGCSCADRRG